MIGKISVVADNYLAGCTPTLVKVYRVLSTSEEHCLQVRVAREYMCVPHYVQNSGPVCKGWQWSHKSGTMLPFSPAELS